ncbi:MAG: carbohydrate ABC transporter permease [Clostridia bacterium]|nr:carbohydrate ABC transporter permease [Clostridia bacterium]
MTGSKSISDNPGLLKRILESRSASTSQSKKYTRSKAGSAVYVVVLLALGIFSVLPLIYCVATSFKPLDELMIFPPRFFVRRPSLQNYLALPGLLSNLQVPLSRYIFNSFFISVVTTFLYVFVSTMAAFVLTKSPLKSRKKVFVVVQYALLFNTYTLAIPQYLIFSYMGIIDTYWAYILPHMASTMGVFLMKQYMEGSVPNAIIEAAKIDGANPYRMFAQIIVPMVKPCIMTLTLFGFRDAWSALPNGTIFNESLKTLPAIMTQINAGGIARSGSAMAVTVIMMIPPILVYMISQSNVLESMNSAGIK